jgi:hypothetical protein
MDSWSPTVGANWRIQLKIIEMVMVLFALLACTVRTVLAEKVILLKEIDRPDTLFVDKDNIYITQGAEVYIYSNTDFILKKKFGKRGEGPGEFKIDPGYHRGGIYLNVQNGSIYVTSIGKVSIITKNGTIKREIKSISGEDFLPFNNKFVGWELIPTSQQNKKAYKAICLYDSKMMKIKEIASIPHSVQRGKGFMIYSGEYIFKTYRGKLFINKGKEFIIDVFDQTGKKLHSINRENKKIKITDYDKEKVLGFYKNYKNTKNAFEYIKSIIKFPEYFPQVRNIFLDLEKLYVATYNHRDNEVEFLVFDLKGKYLGKVFIDIKGKVPLNVPYLYTIFNGKKYQLIENLEEEWEMHIIPIKKSEYCALKRM